MSRGDRRQPIFGDDEDRRTFLNLLARTCEKTGWHMLAYVLMGNHFHLVIETPQPNLCEKEKGEREQASFPSTKKMRGGDPQFDRLLGQLIPGEHLGFRASM